ncbi:40S ribosomal protein S30 [Polytolypa hystricis UAMH7299]|uniref:40S ribosomal protein S30 n=1 Tax=Polytolypa hystricis (strain UAMH7299) TaxID=1447883 RepID=A0A2B7X4J4_POLH7|nr:40S ribosomal protein S30 [Polytolypa hystricis UAMH7299]
MGKVHGSLARAGKVKSQTPKVEPQEKKKTPKGRAKKRLQYTRRFVNVTMTGGKRKVRLFLLLASRILYITHEGTVAQKEVNIPRQE